MKLKSYSRHICGALLFMMAGGGSFNTRANPEDENFPYALHEAIAIKDTANVKALLEAMDKDTARTQINTRDDRGRTALHRAAEVGSDDIIKLLTENGADINARDNEDNTPLHTAIVESRYDAILTLLQAENLNVNAANKGGQTALDLLELKDGSEAVQSLIETLKMKGAKKFVELSASLRASDFYLYEEEKLNEDLGDEDSDVEKTVYYETTSFTDIVSGDPSKGDEAVEWVARNKAPKGFPAPDREGYGKTPKVRKKIVFDFEEKKACWRSCLSWSPVMAAGAFAVGLIAYAAKLARDASHDIAEKLAGQKQESKKGQVKTS